MESELSLLIIDFGDSCVVKVEKGDVGNIGVCLGVLFQGDYCLIHSSFTEVRAAIDALDGEKPVPRIERNNIGALDRYLCYGGAAAPYPINGIAYDALCKLAGHPIPIYEPKAGKWEQLFVLSSDVDFVHAHKVLETVGMKSFIETYGERSQDLPQIKVWRYTK